MPDNENIRRVKDTLKRFANEKKEAVEAKRAQDENLEKHVAFEERVRKLNIDHYDEKGNPVLIQAVVDEIIRRALESGSESYRDVKAHIMQFMHIMEKMAYLIYARRVEYMASIASTLHALWEERPWSEDKAEKSNADKILWGLTAAVLGPPLIVGLGVHEGAKFLENGGVLTWGYKGVKKALEKYGHNDLDTLLYATDYNDTDGLKAVVSSYSLGKDELRALQPHFQELVEDWLKSLGCTPDESKPEGHWLLPDGQPMTNEELKALEANHPLEDYAASLDSQVRLTPY